MTKKIIIASASDQRKKLLKLLGIPFTIKISKIKEIKKTNGCYSSLVKKNALLKAQDIAATTREGIIIGADTLVCLKKGRIIGKPHNLKEAKRTLRTLMRHPCCIYTGLAVIDAKTKKQVIDYEKTKVFMEPLSDREIDRYYRHVTPTDKAGGFDIEGKGSMFIRRIEGCYFNVVGLPLAKLYAMLKKVGVRILSLFLVIFIMGCTTEYNLATRQEETLFYSTEKEIKLGERLSKQFDKNFEINTDVDINERVSRIARRIFDVSDRKELLYTIKVINEDKTNAVSLPGGYIYIFKGLIDQVDNDDQLACVIAHEVGHITAKHSVKKLQALYGYTFLKVLAVQTQDADFVRGVDLAFMSIFTEFSREDEFLADRLGVKYAKKAGFDPSAMADFLNKLKEVHDKEPLRKFSYWRTHPYISQRKAVVRQEISGQLEFRDYLNLTGEQ